MQGGDQRFSDAIRPAGLLGGVAAPTFLTFRLSNYRHYAPLTFPSIISSLSLGHCFPCCVPASSEWQSAHCPWTAACVAASLFSPSSSSLERQSPVFFHLLKQLGNTFLLMSPSDTVLCVILQVFISQSKRVLECGGWEDNHTGVDNNQATIIST